MEELFDIKDKTIVITGAGGVLCGLEDEGVYFVVERWYEGSPKLSISDITSTPIKTK